MRRFAGMSLSALREGGEGKGAFDFQVFRSFVAANWELIDAAVTHEIAGHVGDKLEEPWSSALDGQRLHDDYYGYGYWGVAYPTRYPRWTVKITADPLEGPVAQYILDTPQLRDHAGVARFQKVWRCARKVSLGPQRYTVYVLVREDIEPVAMNELSHEALHALNVLDARSHALMTSIRSGAAEIDIEDRYEDWREFLGELSVIPVFSFVAQFMHAMDTLGPVVMHDVSVGNIGWRHHSFGDFAPAQSRIGRVKVVLHDVGHSSNVLGRVNVELMPRLERNPAIPILGSDL